MPPAFDLNSIVLPSKERSRAIEAGLMFRRRTIWAVYISANGLALALIFWNMMNRTALLTQVAPDFRASMIGVGVFLGVLVAAVEREAWLLGFGGRRAPHTAAGIAIGMAALVVGSGFGGDFVAGKLWEWRAFHGLPAVGVDHSFTVVARENGRSGNSLELQDIRGGNVISINCSYRMYLRTPLGERLTLPVETGRGGVQRVSLPPLEDVRRG